MTKDLEKRQAYEHLFRDSLLIFCSIVIAIFLVQAGLLGQFLSLAQGLEILGSFVAGIFFTSVFTIAPASVALAELSQHTSPFIVALWAAFGAVIGDLIIFLFLRDSFGDDLLKAMKYSPFKKLLSLSRFAVVRWLMPIIGALIIASPLPDELGLALLGISRTRIVVLIPVAFVMNYLGVLLIALFANAL